jgi:hypothetical protein
VARGDIVGLLDDYAGRPATHRQLLGAISRLYAWARRAKPAGISPTADIASDRVGQGAGADLAGADQVWHAISSIRYRDLLHLMILTRQTRTDVAGMTWGESS